MERRFTVRLPNDLERKMEIRAKNSYMSKSDVVRQALIAYLNE